MKFNIGDEVLCIHEDDLPYLVGRLFTIIGFTKNVGGTILYKVRIEIKEGTSLQIDEFPFFEHEIVHASKLIKELL